jgi:YHS domain-containing protein
MKTWLHCGVLLLALGLCTRGALAEPAINTNGSELAIGGFDVVAYFSDGRPLRGKPEYKSTFAGATWLFADAQHKALFERTPAKYLPVYNGYCAYGVARGKLVTIAPEAFTIRGGSKFVTFWRSAT